MTDLFSIHPAISVHVTIVIGVTLTLSAAGLALLFRLPRAARKPPQPPARWRIEYESRTGFALRISKTPPDPRAARPNRLSH